MITFTGAGSVSDRTVFTNRGPIVKPPVPVLAGANLIVSSPDEVTIQTGGFTKSYVGKTVTISGSPGGRNDGTFYVSEVRGPTRLRLRGANLDFSDPADVEAQVVALANDLQAKYNAHRPSASHGTADLANAVTSPTAVDLASAVLTLNQLRAALRAHSLLVGPSVPPVHSFADPGVDTWMPPARDLNSAVLLANELRARYEAHRQDRFFHLVDDFANRTAEPAVLVTVAQGAMVGPFAWTVSDPRDGQVADDPSDVSVLVNSLPAAVEAVFGLLGAVVLSSKPAHGDSVLVDYKYMSNPPTQFERLNSFEFVLNQDGNNGMSGVPRHLYRQRSSLVDPTDSARSVRSPDSPMRVGWKHKGFERAYTACLNDPNTLLLNVPSNKIMYPVLSESVFETVVRYDPSTLPQDATDPWTYEGSGTLSLAPGGGELMVKDDSGSTSVTSGPPFFHHQIDLTYDSYVSAAYRLWAEDLKETLTYDGCFTGVGFGFTDGQKAGLVGLISTDAVNLSSAIVMANDLKAKFGSHLVLTGVHLPNDTADGLDVVDASDLDSLMVLLNREKYLYNVHVAAGPNRIHLFPDSVNVVSAPDAVNLGTSVALANALRVAYNSHRTAAGVHYNNDTADVVGLVKQVGVLTNSGFVEEQSSWVAFAHDWTVETTYRAYRDAAGNVGVYLSGDMSPRAHVDRPSLADASGLDLKLDPVHQTFFGSLGFAAMSLSHWKFARVNVSPVDSVQVVGNKSVAYVPSVQPELDPSHPWIAVGQGGCERATGSLRIDSTSSVSEEVALASGLVTGEYKGFLRLEPSLSDRSTLSFEFTASSSFYSFGIDNRSLGVHFGDGTFATQLCFLQSNPVAATVLGTAAEPFAVVLGDQAIFTVDDGPTLVATSPGTVTTAAGAAALINTAAPAVAAAESGSVRVSSPTLGSGSALRVVGGQVFEKLGIPIGTYFGRDTLPESRVAWSGSSLPDQAAPPWPGAGGQAAAMMERTLRVSDLSTSDFRSYTLSDPTVTSNPISYASDWKADFRVRVLSYAPGDQVVSGPGLRFCGTLMNVDEGPLGKSVDLHLSQDLGGSPYVAVYSYDPSAGSLDYVAEYPFAWSDGQPHSYSVYTSKAANLVLVLADGIVLGTFSYSSLKVGAFGPSVSFGSGSNPVSNCDMRTALSTSDWDSAIVVSDEKVSDPLAASRRFVGLYKGGDPTVLSSYYLHQVDWTVPHTYRVVRDPVSAVSVFVDGGATPVISSGYDVLTIPLVTLDFLSGIVPSGKFVAFGSFSSSEVARSSWGQIGYSIGNMTLTDGLVPPHQVLNQANVVVSPEHLETKKLHNHFGTTSWSGGTPTDDFMSDPSVPAHAVLGEGTPPFEMSMDLESQGGLITTVTPVESIPSVDLVNERGQIASFEDDLANAVTSGPVVSGLLSDAVALTNALLAAASGHLARKPSHVKVDSPVALAPAPVDLPSLVLLVNGLKARLNEHFVKPGVHVVNDTVDGILTPDASDLTTSIALANVILASYEAHRVRPGVHSSTVVVRLDPPPGVIYEGMKFFTFPSGTGGLVSTFSDDETLYVRGSVSNQTLQSLTYPAGSLPDRAIIVSQLAEPFGILDGDVLTIALNRGQPVNVTFLAGDTDVASVVGRINGTAGLPAGLASSWAPSGLLRLVEPAGGPASFIEVSGTAAVKLGLGSCHAVPWILTANDSSLVTASVVSAGPTDFLRIGTSGLGTAAAYAARTGLAGQPSVGFSAIFSVRIQAWAYGADGDTGIYVGVGGAGLSVAVGFVLEAGVRTVILRNLATWERLVARQFDWGDGAFHRYAMVRAPGGPVSLEAS